MGYAEETRIDGTREVTFLYQLAPGITTESFGVECGRLAGLPEPLLALATSRAENMRSVIENRVLPGRLRKALQYVQDIGARPSPGTAPELLRELTTLAEGATRIP